MLNTSYSMNELLNLRVHLGHKSGQWNPKMASYILGIRNGIHIIDIEHTVVLLKRALKFLEHISEKKGTVLFVCSNERFREIIKETSDSSSSYYTCHRWIGGFITNWEQVKLSLNEDIEFQGSKHDRKVRNKRWNKLFFGFKGMPSIPTAVVIIDTPQQRTCIKELNKLNIPIIAILDTNADPTGISYPIPGNDDSIEAVRFYCSLFKNAILNGKSKKN